MITKYLPILIALGVCTAFPVEEDVRPPNAIGAPEVPVGGPESVVPLSGPGRPMVPASEPEPVQLEPVNDNSDLKTDNTFWWRRSYYPVYGRSYSYYRPRSYSYYYPRAYSYYNHPYSYWNSYW